MGDAIQNSGNATGLNQVSPGTGTEPPNIDSSSPEGESTKQSYNFSTLGLKFSTQMIAGKRIVSSFMTAFLLLFGLGAGVILVTQPQIFERQAQINPNVSTPACGEEAACSNDVLVTPDGSQPCLDRTGINHCCTTGQIIIGDACASPPGVCDISTKCSLNSKTFGASPCLGSDREVYYCCKKGSRLSTGISFCYKSPF